MFGCKKRVRDEPIISEANEIQRMLVKGKGWTPFHEITWGDQVKMTSGKWQDACEIKILQEEELYG